MKEKKKMRLSVAGGKHTIMDEEELEVAEDGVRTSDFTLPKILDMMALTRGAF